MSSARRCVEIPGGLDDFLRDHINQNQKDYKLGKCAERLTFNSLVVKLLVDYRNKLDGPESAVKGQASAVAA